MNLLVTGGAGFIGSNYVRMLRETRANVQISLLDALTYAGNLSTIEDLVDGKFCKFYPGHIQDSCVVDGIIKADKITTMLWIPMKPPGYTEVMPPIVPI